jgi:hypothetical protein
MKQKCLGKIKVDGGLGWSPRAQGEGFAYLTRKIPTILFRFQSFCPSKEPRTQTPVSNDNPDCLALPNAYPSGRSSASVPLPLNSLHQDSSHARPLLPPIPIQPTSARGESPIFTNLGDGEGVLYSSWVAE